MILTTIKDIKSLISKTLVNKNSPSCYLFGSYAKDKANELYSVMKFIENSI